MSVRLYEFAIGQGIIENENKYDEINAYYCK